MELSENAEPEATRRLFKTNETSIQVYDGFAEPEPARHFGFQG